MITHKERTETIKNGRRNSERIFRKLSPEEQDERRQKAINHENDAGLSSSDEYAYLKRKEAEGLEGGRSRR